MVVADSNVFLSLNHLKNQCCIRCRSMPGMMQVRQICFIVVSPIVVLISYLIDTILEGTQKWSNRKAL